MYSTPKAFCKDVKKVGLHHYFPHLQSSEYCRFCLSCSCIILKTDINRHFLATRSKTLVKSIRSAPRAKNSLVSSNLSGVTRTGRKANTARRRSRIPVPAQSPKATSGMPGKGGVRAEGEVGEHLKDPADRSGEQGAASSERQRLPRPTMRIPPWTLSMPPRFSAA